MNGSLCPEHGFMELDCTSEMLLHMLPQAPAKAAAVKTAPAAAVKTTPAAAESSSEDSSSEDEAPPSKKPKTG